jgi:hypothetical protein
MSLIKIVTGVTKETVTFQKNVSAIEVIMSKNTGVNLDVPTVEIYLMNTKNSVTTKFSPRLAIKALFEMGSVWKDRFIYREGSVAGTVTVTGNAETTVVDFAPVIKKVIGQIDLTDGNNGIEMGKDDLCYLNLDGLDATTTYEFRAIEEADVDNNHEGYQKGDVIGYEYALNSTKQEQNAKFSTKGVVRFAVERSAAFESIEIGHKHGAIRFGIADLDQQMRDSFGDVYKTEYTIPGSTEDLNVTGLKDIPESWLIIPVNSETDEYMQINSIQVGGVYTAINVIVLREQIVGKD